MIDGSFAERNVPEEMPHFFQLEHCESVLDIPRVPAMDPLPIHQLNPTFPACADLVSCHHIVSSLETMQTAVAIRVGATDVQCFP